MYVPAFASATEQSVLEYFRRATHDAAAPFLREPTEAALRPVPGRGHFRVWEVAGVPTAAHATLTTVGLSTLRLPRHSGFTWSQGQLQTTRMSFEEADVSRHELALVLQRPVGQLTAATVDAFYALANAVRMELSADMRALRSGSVLPSAPSLHIAGGAAGFLVHTLPGAHLALPDGGRIQTGSTSAPIDVLTLLPLHAAELAHLQAASGATARREAANALCSQLEQLGAIDVTVDVEARMPTLPALRSPTPTPPSRRCLHHWTPTP